MLKKKKTKLSIFLSVGKFAFLAFYLVIVLFPFYWMVVTSLKPTQADIYSYPIQYWPKTPSLANYTSLLTTDNFGIYFLNSLVVSLIAGIFAVSIGLFASYVLARYNFKGRGILMFFFLFTQMIPMFLIIAPLYQMMSAVHMTNKISTLILLYTNMMIPFSVVTLRGFFQGVPRAIEESAQIDGCGRLKALFTVVIPIILPGIASTVIFAFVNAWNELFLAIMFLDNPLLKTVPVALNGLILKYDIAWGQLSAGIVLAILPTMILFAFAQKYMAGGLTAGAVKG